MNKHIKKYLAAALIAVGVASQAMAANSDTEDATITVTPVANVSMSLSPSTYDFGNIGVNTSTTSAIPMVLTNTGDVNIGVTAEIQGDDSGSNWVADTSTTTPNHYVLYVATSSFAPAATGLEFGTNNRIGKATGNTGTPIALRGLGGNSASPSLTPAGGGFQAVSLYYRLDMPVTVTAATQRTTLVHFIGTAQ
jgi:hypothetical protein